MTPTLNLCLLVPLAPLAGALLAGLLGRTLGRRGSHTVAILGVLVSAVLSGLILQSVLTDHQGLAGAVYTWGSSGGLHLEVGFLIDPLSATMMFVVSFVSLMVHVYTIGYMADDPGYQRFFAYICLLYTSPSPRD